MSNPNRQHFSVEPDDEKNLSDSESPRAPITPDNLRFLFDKQKSEEAAFRQYENDGEDADTVGPGKRRKKAARSLKGLFKSRNLAAKAEKKAATDQSPLPDNVFPINFRRQATAERPVNEDLIIEHDSSARPQAGEGREVEADVQETFRVNADTADSPDHQAAEEDSPGVFNVNEDVPASEPTASGGAGSGGGYDGPPAQPPKPPTPATPSRPRVEDYLPPAAVHEPIRVLPSSVERRGGIVGPLTAFFAANYLSRRRNRRARKETNKLKAEVQDTQRQQQIESRRLRNIEDSIRNNSPAPVSPPAVEPEKRVVMPPAPVSESSPTKVSEILASAAVNKNNPIQSQPMQEKGVRPAVEAAPIVAPRLPEPEAPQVSKSNQNVHRELASKPAIKELNNVQLEQGRAIQALQEQQQKQKPRPMQEERRPQIKPDEVVETQKAVAQEYSSDRSPVHSMPKAGMPASNAAPAPSPAPASKASSRSANNDTAISTPYQPMNVDNQKELYRKSMRAGIVTGLVVAGLGALAYIVLL